MQKKIEVTIEAPETPLFLRNLVKGRDKAILIPIQDLTDEELAEIGKEWTARLIKKARKRRKLVENKQKDENTNSV